MEQSTILNQRLRPPSRSEPDVEFVLNGKYELRNGGLAADEERAQYRPVDYTFISLGRSPIVGAQATIDIEFRNLHDDAVVHRAAKLRAELGDYRSDEKLHGRLWIQKEIYATAVIRWDSSGATSDVGPLDFRPYRRHRPEPAAKKSLQDRMLELAGRVPEEQNAAVAPIRPRVPEPTTPIPPVTAPESVRVDDAPGAGAAQAPPRETDM